MEKVSSNVSHTQLFLMGVVVVIAAFIIVSGLRSGGNVTVPNVLPPTEYALTCAQAGGHDVPALDMDSWFNPPAAPTTPPTPVAPYANGGGIRFSRPLRYPDYGINTNNPTSIYQQILNMNQTNLSKLAKAFCNTLNNTCTKNKCVLNPNGGEAIGGGSTQSPRANSGTQMVHIDCKCST